MIRPIIFLILPFLFLSSRACSAAQQQLNDQCGKPGARLTGAGHVAVNKGADVHANFATHHCTLQSAERGHTDIVKSCCPWLT